MVPRPLLEMRWTISNGLKWYAGIYVTAEDIHIVYIAYVNG